VRHIEGITRVVQSIVRGDRSRRLPTHGHVRHVNQLAHEINFMLGEIERLMLEVKGVCDNVARDLRTPLMRLLAGLQRVPRAPDRWMTILWRSMKAIREIRVLLTTFGAMLRIAEVESGARRAGFTTVDLAHISGDVVEFYEPMAKK
jgi:signal transduction histidine kinase